MNIQQTFENGTPQAGMQVKEYISILLRHKVLIAVSTLSMLLSTILFVYKIDDVYESYSTIVVDQRTQIVNGVLTSAAQPLSYYEGILDSRTFLEMAVDSIGLDVFRSAAKITTRENAMLYLQENITLRETKYTSFLRFNCKSGNARLSYLMGSIGIQVFLKRCTEVKTEESRNAILEIENQIRIIREKLEQSEYDYRAFKDRSGNIAEGVTPELKTLQDAYGANLAQLGIKEADLSAEKNQLEKMEAKFAPADDKSAPEIHRLRAKLRELEMERLRLENLGIVLTSGSPIEREIKEIEKQLLDAKPAGQQQQTPDVNGIQQWQSLRKSVLEKENELNLFKRKLETYSNAIAGYKKGNPNLLGQSLELLRLERSKEVYEKLYNTMLEKSEEQKITNASNASGVKVVDIARMPESPLPKNAERYYIIALLLGLGLGIGLALMRELNDTSIKSNEDVERHLKLPVLGTIPHIQHNKKDDITIRRKSGKNKAATSVNQYPRHLLKFSGDESVTAEAYRSLRTNLSFVSPDHPIRTLILTSAGPSEGKSLTIANLALAYAQMGKKTVLIDTDLRRPVEHHIFGLKREPGFSDLFVEGTTIDDVVKESGRENLSIITAGTFTPNPAELLASNRMNVLIEELKERFDMIFFDTPPVIAVTDAALLGTKVDGIMLVVRSHKTAREVARHAVNNLHNVGIRCLGVVLNDIDLSHRYSSYGYYKYYYHYYKSKS